MPSTSGSRTIARRASRRRQQRSSTTDIAASEPSLRFARRARSSRHAPLRHQGQATQSQRDATPARCSFPRRTSRSRRTPSGCGSATAPLLLRTSRRLIRRSRPTSRARGSWRTVAGDLRYGLRLPKRAPMAAAKLRGMRNDFVPQNPQVRSCGRSCGGKAKAISAPVPRLQVPGLRRTRHPHGPVPGMRTRPRLRAGAPAHATDCSETSTSRLSTYARRSGSVAICLPGSSTLMAQSPPTAPSSSRRRRSGSPTTCTNWW